MSFPDVTDKPPCLLLLDGAGPMNSSKVSLDNIVLSAATTANLEWNDLSLPGGVTSGTDGWQSAQYRLKDGIVRLRGLIRTGSPPKEGYEITTLPVDARPAGTVYVPVSSHVSSRNYLLSVQPTGVVTLVHTNADPNPGYFSLDGVFFHVSTDDWTPLDLLPPFKAGKPDPDSPVRDVALSKCCFIPRIVPFRDNPGPGAHVQMWTASAHACMIPAPLRLFSPGISLSHAPHMEAYLSAAHARTSHSPITSTTGLPRAPQTPSYMLHNGNMLLLRGCVVAEGPDGAFVDGDVVALLHEGMRVDAAASYPSASHRSAALHNLRAEVSGQLTLHAASDSPYACLDGISLYIHGYSQRLGSWTLVNDDQNRLFFQPDREGHASLLLTLNGEVQ